MIYHTRTTCRGCSSKDLHCFLSLGNMPLAGGFLTEKDIPKEEKVPLDVYFCNTCGLVQILNTVNPDVLFENYYYSSSTIQDLRNHFKSYAQYLKKNYLTNTDMSLFEFGSNDGVLLEQLKKHGYENLYGIDPSINMTTLAKEKGLQVTKGFFNKKTAREYKKNVGHMDVVTGSNVFAHVDDIHEILNAAKILLKPNGVFIVEVHYLADLIDSVQYDTIYHEHLSYYSVYALKNILKITGFTLVDVMHIGTHGGSIRVVATQNNTHKVSKRVSTFLKREKQKGLHKKSIFEEFAANCRKHRLKLRKLLIDLKKQDKKIVGYGAAGRGTILLNYCNIGSNVIDYIVDASPLRNNVLMPGVHIPTYAIEKARKDLPDYFFIIAWNYAESILIQEKKLTKKGVSWILPFPKITTIS